jgi:hypothetical protein
MPGNADKLISTISERFADLTEAEKLLLRAAAQGVAADYRDGSAELDNPSKADQWREKRVLRAEVIRDLCSTSKVWNSAGNGKIEIVGAMIAGRLTLDYGKLDLPLCFAHCMFSEEISLRYATLHTLDLEGTHVRGIKADGVRTEGSVRLRRGFRTDGAVSLYESNITGDLDCRDGKFINPGQDALLMSSANIGGHVLLSDGFS